MKSFKEYVSEERVDEAIIDPKNGEFGDFRDTVTPEHISKSVNTAVKQKHGVDLKIVIDKNMKVKSWDKKAFGKLPFFVSPVMTLKSFYRSDKKTRKHTFTLDLKWKGSGSSGATTQIGNMKIDVDGNVIGKA